MIMNEFSTFINRYNKRSSRITFSWFCASHLIHYNGSSNAIETLRAELRLDSYIRLANHMVNHTAPAQTSAFAFMLEKLPLNPQLYIYFNSGLNLALCFNYETYN